jgi:GGDEF domain-containing protein
MQRWQPSKGEASGWHAEVPVELHGRVRWCEVAISPAVELAAEGNLVTVQMVDVTSRREAEERLAHLALRDGLTGLANRVLLDDRLQRALTECRRTGLQVGVAFLDVDSFKLMNDVHGHDVGDRFLVVLGEVVARIRGAVGPPVTFAGVTVASDISIGATLGGGDCEPRELLRRADAAMYAQKKAGGGRTSKVSPPSRPVHWHRRSATDAIRSDPPGSSAFTGADARTRCRSRRSRGRSTASR